MEFQSWNKRMFSHGDGSFDTAAVLSFAYGMADVCKTAFQSPAIWQRGIVRSANFNFFLISPNNSEPFYFDSICVIYLYPFVDSIKMLKMHEQVEEGGEFSIWATLQSH